MTDPRYASVKLPREFVAWLKVRAARARLPMYEYLLRQFPEVPKRIYRGRHPR